MQMKVADVIVKCLEAEGVEYAFGIVGYHYLPLFRALKDSSIKFISIKHESSAGFMAAHYARFAQKPCVILGTAGPGAMNLLNGVAELYKTNLPCFIITPMSPLEFHGKNAAQDDSGLGNTYSFPSIIRHLTKKSILCHHPQNTAFYMQDLLRNCLEGRKGPVHFGIPSNFLETTIDFSPLQPEGYRNVSEEQIEPGKLARIAGLIEKSKRPLLFVGHRAWYPDASENIKQLSAAFGIPVVLSASAKGLFDEFSPYFGGIMDLYGHRSAEALIKKSDLIISIGEDLGELSTNKYEPNFLDNKLVQIDLDGYDIGRNYPMLLSSCGDLNASLEYLHAQLKLTAVKPFFEETFSQEFHDQNAAQWEDMHDHSLPLKAPRIFDEIAASIPENAIVIGDMGANSFSALRHFRSRQQAFSILMCGYSMGQGVSGCIGCKLASPSSTVISICGDGSFLMNGMEIATARQYDIPIIWMVFVDRKYGMVDFAQKLFYTGLEFCSDIFVPDLSKFAESFSIDYYQVLDSATLKSSIVAASKKYREDRRGAIIEIPVASENILPIKPRAVKYIIEAGDPKESGRSPYLMKSFKRMLREKV